VDPARRPTLIETRLVESLAATYVEVVDDSALHAAHLGAKGGGGHFRVVVVSPLFEDASRVEAQRMVYRALADLMVEDIHALQMQTFTPDAWRRFTAS